MSLAFLSKPIPERVESQPPIDLRRGDDARLQVSRIATELIWERGLSATRGEEISAAAGISLRTLWRYFRSKEACVEPVLHALTTPMVEMFAAWPAHLSFEAYVDGFARVGDVDYTADQIRGMRIVALGHDEPALRSSWLMVCDEAERRVAPALAARLGLPEPDAHLLQIAAAITGANRALNDHLTHRFVHERVTPPAAELARDLVRTVVESSGGLLGPAITSATEGDH